MAKLLPLLLFTLLKSCCQAQAPEKSLTFQYQGVTLDGVLNMPDTAKPKGIVLIVHGSGSTNAIAQQWYLDVRKSILKAGYATYMWDKMGCGKSGGSFDYNQSVQSSAAEVIAAIHNLKQKHIPGADDIGLWGISRAGWINPLVINQYKDIRFWISVSGVDAMENFNYLFKQNLKIEGHPKEYINIMLDELRQGTLITNSGGSYEEYIAATANLRKNEFWNRFNSTESTKEGYYSFQKGFMKEELDPETGLQLYIKDFDAMLSNIQCPVLALFGEKDMNVDWNKTKTLYQETLSSNTDLTIQSFPDCNHNLFQCKTGGFYEFEDNDLPWDRCAGFLDIITEWLNDIK